MPEREKRFRIYKARGGPGGPRKGGLFAGTPGPGRPVGSKNKATKTLKEMILSALEAAGGEGYLLARAQDEHSAFMTLIGKVLPVEQRVSGADGGALKLEHTVDDQRAPIAAFVAEFMTAPLLPPLEPEEMLLPPTPPADGDTKH